MENLEFEFITELCPYCNNEVSLCHSFELQKCPTCGKVIKPCSLCNKSDCKKCPLDFYTKIPSVLYNKLNKLGLINSTVRSYNIGSSDYSKHIIQPWSIWLDYSLDGFDADIIKRVLRTKEGESRITDYEKIIHICQEKIRQLKK